jgi:hypothetical protein
MPHGMTLAVREKKKTARELHAPFSRGGTFQMYEKQ